MLCRQVIVQVSLYLIRTTLCTEIGISKKFIVEPELLYSIKGDKFPATILTNDRTLSLNYFSIPVLGGFRLNDKLTILLGP